MIILVQCDCSTLSYVSLCLFVRKNTTFFFHKKEKPRPRFSMTYMPSTLLLLIVYIFIDSLKICDIASQMIDMPLIIICLQFSYSIIGKRRRRGGAIDGVEIITALYASCAFLNLIIYLSYVTNCSAHFSCGGARLLKGGKTRVIRNRVHMTCIGYHI